VYAATNAADTIGTAMKNATTPIVVASESNRGEWSTAVKMMTGGNTVVATVNANGRARNKNAIGSM
jgi:hypothetical protein